MMTKRPSTVGSPRHRVAAQAIGLVFCGFFISTLGIENVSAQAGDPALPGNHPLTQPQAGDLLIHELRCGACHRGIERGPLPEKTAPDLSEVGGRIAPEYLIKYLTSPLSTHPGTSMPDLLAAQPEGERGRIAEALTHFLVAQSKTLFPTNFAPQGHLLEGKTLYHSVGCVACHGPRAAIDGTPLVTKKENETDDDDDQNLTASKTFKPIAIPLEQVPAKYSLKSLGEFLFQPLKVRSSGRMPDLKLTPAESLAIAEYLIGEPHQPATALVPQEPLVAKGKKIFPGTELCCVSCLGRPPPCAADRFPAACRSFSWVFVRNGWEESPVFPRRRCASGHSCRADRNPTTRFRAPRGGENADHLPLYRLPYAR